jgi:hypothetical protein
VRSDLRYTESSYLPGLDADTATRLTNRKHTDTIKAIDSGLISGDRLLVEQWVQDDMMQIMIRIDGKLGASQTSQTIGHPESKTGFSFRGIPHVRQ